MAQQKKNKKKQVKFEDLLALYKFLKDVWGQLSLIEERLNKIEEWQKKHEEAYKHL